MKGRVNREGRIKKILKQYFKNVEYSRKAQRKNRHLKRN